MTSLTRFIAPVAVAVSILGTAGATAQDRPHARDHAHHWMERFMATYDLDGDGKVALDEVTTDQKRLFGAIDTDGDGFLSPNEFRRRGHLLQLFATTSLFDLLDADGSGTLTAEEILGPSQRWFARYDADHSQAIETAEMPERPAGDWRGRRPRGDEARDRPRSWSERFFRAYDADADGKVTMTEIKTVLDRLFRALDANDDKFVTPEEFRTGPRAREIFAASSIFDLLDVEPGGEGKLSLDEIHGPTERWFKRYDANRDDKMTAEELSDRFRGREEGRRR
jgi:Ca2+-binding EF-hand superfamily protein